MKTTLSILLFSSFISSAVFASNDNRHKHDAKAKKSTIDSISFSSPKQEVLTVDVKDNSNTPVKVVIYDSEGNVLYKDLLKDSGSVVRQSYNMAGIPSGAYTFEVSTDNHYAKKQVVISTEEQRKMEIK